MNDGGIESPPRSEGHPSGVMDRLIRFCLENKLVVGLLALVVIGWGIMVAPFDWHLTGLPRDPVPVDAIPDIGENQQIVFSEWPGRSPQDVEDQISYPLTAALLGIPGVKTVRSFSMFGFSIVYVIFEDGIEFYWSRSRLLEKLSSLPVESLPAGVVPRLGPDATALGQVFWYTLEGRDEEGRPAGGWSLEELRSIQDWHVRYALMAAGGVSEVASVGGYVREYQIDVDPDAMRAANVSLSEVVAAVRMANRDVGARSIEINRVEYVIRGLGFVREIADLENAVVKVHDHVPIYVKNVAHVTEGPAPRRGALDKEGAEAVGGVVVVRYGANPLAVIKNVKAKIAEIAPGMPQKTLSDGTTSRVTVVPFYDRSGLIHETLDTLKSALFHQILVTVIVVLVMMLRLRSSLLVSALLPVAVLLCFIAMRTFGVDANIVALSGIAIAIGTMVDMGVILTENISRKLDEADVGASSLEVVYRATREVGGAVLTAVATTVISFLPVFTMTAAEGKLFKPLAFTKTFALLAAVLLALTLLAPAAQLLLGRRRRIARRPVPLWRQRLRGLVTGMVAFIVALLLADQWHPLGVERGWFGNLVFVAFLLGTLLLFFFLFLRAYARILRWCLDNKGTFLALPLVITLVGAFIWLGFDGLLGWLPTSVKTWRPVSQFAHAFPGLGKEFMPPLDEGSFLYMPSTMPHASIGEVLDVMQKQDMAFRQLPEVETAVGKLGRVESPLDPAPISMIETIINYKPEFLRDEEGRHQRFRFDADALDLARDSDGHPAPAPDGEPYYMRGRFQRDSDGQLVPDSRGRRFRNWRPPLDPDVPGNEGREAWAGIRNPDDIWASIVEAGKVPGTTSAPRLQPISARIVMLQSGMRAPMGVKVSGPDLERIERVGLEIERYLKQVPSIEPASVFADRIVGKPYLEVRIDRQAIARYGIRVDQVQEVIEIAIGGKGVTQTVEGRERYGVRVRYMRELRDNIEGLGRILVAAPDGAQIPLTQLATIEYARGPQMIRSEDSFPVGYVLFDMVPGHAEVAVVEQARAYLDEKLRTGELVLPAGVSFAFAGSYENQVRSERRLMVVLPLALVLIFIILYLQFRSTVTSALVFGGIAVAWSGGFLLLWLYGQPWFLDFPVMGANLRELFQVHPINLSVAVWVGFLALFGIATDDGVVIATYLKQTFARRRPASIDAIRAATLEAGQRRARPCLMTTATTVLALLPVLTSTGRGADVMVPMAIPSVGGMTVAVVTMLVVPVLYAAVMEARLKRGARQQKTEMP